ncbi:peroxiredoxin family protein [Sphingobacterium sp. Mn56C]|uniref:peroxiredoxin family protein n=1 Tax=Sphingobacterium sp. Mn56C TaxID=3395261 RepID=UPI003BE95CA2
MMIPVYFVASAVMSLSSCNNAPKNANASTNQVETVNGDHANHDHADHAGHDHGTAAEGQQPAMDNLAQGAPAQTIPAFNFYKVKSGVSFTNADIPKGKKTVFILFDPNCSHCRDEASALGKNYNKIKNVNLYFVSMNDPALMASFLETFGKELVGKPNVEVLYDRNQEFIQKIHVPKQFPANYVYGADNKLQTFWDGDKNINDIVAAYTK